MQNPAEDDCGIKCRVGRQELRDVKVAAALESKTISAFARDAIVAAARQVIAATYGTSDK